jgi:hypothetical protein
VEALLEIQVVGFLVAHILGQTFFCMVLQQTHEIFTLGLGDAFSSRQHTTCNVCSSCFELLFWRRRSHSFLESSIVAFLSLALWWMIEVACFPAVKDVGLGEMAGNNS